MIAWTLFFHPIRLSFHSLLWLLPPLLLGVAVIYKAVRVEHVRQMPRSVLVLSVYMMGGLVALGLCLYLAHEYWPF